MQSEYERRTKRAANGTDTDAMIDVSTRVITPELATELLAARRPDNRDVSQAQVKHFARLMLEGLWNPTAQPILLDEHGRLIDGQHRLAAVVAAHTTITFLVLQGYDPSVLPVIDTGRIRSAADTLVMRGFLNGRNRAAALRLLIAWERSPDPWRTNSTTRISNAEVSAGIEQYPFLDESLSRARRLTTARIPGGDGFWAAILYKFAEVDPDRTDEFVERLRNGADLPVDSPLLLLRNRLIGPADDSRDRSVSWVHRLRAEGTAALIIKTWNAWYSGKSLRQLKWGGSKDQPEPFPLVAGLAPSSAAAA